MVVYSAIPSSQLVDNLFGFIDDVVYVSDLCTHLSIYPSTICFCGQTSFHMRTIARLWSDGIVSASHLSLISKWFQSFDRDFSAILVFISKVIAILNNFVSNRSLCAFNLLRHILVYKYQLSAVNSLSDYVKITTSSVAAGKILIHSN